MRVFDSDGRSGPIMLCCRRDVLPLLASMKLRRPCLGNESPSTAFVRSCLGGLRLGSGKGWTVTHLVLTHRQTCHSGQHKKKPLVILISGWVGGVWEGRVVKISCLMGRHHVKDGSKFHFTDQWIPCSNGKISHCFCERYVVCWSTDLPGIFLGCLFGTQEFGKETLTKTSKNRRRWTHLNSTFAKSIQQNRQ